MLNARNVKASLSDVRAHENGQLALLKERHCLELLLDGGIFVVRQVFDVVFAKVLANLVHS
jgi:hypothetical protein